MRSKFLGFLFLVISFIAIMEANIVPRENNRTDKRKCDVAIAALFQNEAAYLKEWIEFHKLIGVKHFYLYNNLSTDNFEEVLAPYIKKGDVELYDLPVKLSDGKIYLEWQVGVYNHTLGLCRNKNKWVAFIDIDEFICLVKEDDIYEFLKKYEYAGGLAVNWVMHGTSGVYDLSPKDLLIEKLIKRYPLDWNENNMIKSIVRPEYVQNCIDAHTFEYHPNVFAVHPNHQKFSHTPGFASLPVEEIRLNHYWFRTEKFFYEVKLPRRRIWGDKRSQDEIRQQLDSSNSIEDKSMSRFVKPLKKRMK